jgi:hypothetical protein
MELYSYKGETPKVLPQRIRLENGETRTSLNELSKEDLEDLGFIGPIEMSNLSVDENTERIDWNGNEYIVRQLNEVELYQIRVNQIKNIDYVGFWNDLIETKFYKKIRALSANSLSINTICTEINGVFNDAKSGHINQDKIQKYINIIFLSIEFTTEEKEEIFSVIEKNKLDLVYIIPDEEYISSKVYDFASNNILDPSPYPSWTIVDGQWKAPIEKPDLVNIYEWDEDNMQWIFSEKPVDPIK